jgi:hypothetical protein
LQLKGEESRNLCLDKPKGGNEGSGDKAGEEVERVAE